MDKTLEAAETVLSARDFENIPEREVDLRRLGIRVDSGRCPDKTGMVHVI